MDFGLDSGAIAAIAYGILSLVGGVIGYLQAKSTTSLISGGISGVLLIVMGILQSQSIVWARAVAIAITVLLIIVFIVRLAKTRKLMPAALMIGAGIIALLAMTLIAA